MKELPYSKEAEKAVLGSMLVSKDAMLNSVVRLSEEDFFINDHKLIFNAIRTVYERGIDVDIVTVVEQFTNSNTLDLLENKDLIYELGEDVVSASNIDEYIRIVQDKTTLRKLVTLANEVSQKWKSEDIKDIGDYVSQIESDTLAITRSRNVGGFKTTKEVIDVLKEKLFANSKMNGGLTGVTSGFTDIDKITHGFQKGDLIILAARPSVGKTALALNFMMNAAIKQNITVAMFSVEMPAEQLMQRMLSATSSVNGDKIRGLDLNDKDWTKIDVASNQLSKAKIFVDDTSGIKLGDLMVKARKLKSLHDDLGLIVVDYLQIISGSEQARKEGEQQEITEITNGLKTLARDLNIPIIALSQLSRVAERRDKTDHRPMLSDLRGSGSIEQVADLVMFIYREDYYENQKGGENKEKKEGNVGDSGIAEVSISKHRNGAQGTVKLVFLKEFGLFSNYSKADEE